MSTNALSDKTLHTSQQIITGLVLPTIDMSSAQSSDNASTLPIQTSDSEQSISAHSQEHNDAKKYSSASLPIITGPNGAVINSDKFDYEESEKSLHSNKNRSHGNYWSILEGLKDGQRCEEKPNKFDGFMLKRRKWPLKGWHKRYFSLENGILSYSKSANDMAKGKIHGSVDVGLSVISTKSSSKRIDIDAEEIIYHIKVKNRIQFMHWVAMLRHHRLYRQHQIAFGSKLSDVTPIRSAVVGFSAASTPNANNESKVAAWILGSDGDDDFCDHKEFNDLQIKLVKLSSLLQVVEMQIGSNNNNIADSETASLKKHRRRFLLRRNKKANNDKPSKKQNTIEVVVNNNDLIKPLPISHHLSSSHPVLNDMSSASNVSSENCIMTQSFNNDAESDYNDHSSHYNSLTPNKALTDFVFLANDVNNSFRTLLRSLQTESPKKGLRLYNENYNSNLVYSLRNSLKEALKQNIELKSKLDQIHEASDVSVFSPFLTPDTPKSIKIEDDDNDEVTVIHQPLGHSTSRESASVLSISEYFDAEENLSTTSTTSTEDEDEDEDLGTDISDDATEYGTFPYSAVDKTNVSNTTGRRSKLPAPQPDSGDFSLWNLLCKNIGKDLSKISMPVTINEPLNVLQRLCEELEYSELLDKAAVIADNCERMLYIAAFAVSAYSSSHYRAGHKPFNPLLGETFECLREDKGFRFVSEQVSHHPPVSACHADSENYLFWQDIRIKSKFWGKSMEIIPFGNVHVFLKQTKSHYKWNKVTTCVHNLFKGQRWVDQYGEMTITDGNLTCKLTFEKASYWSNKKYEVNGVIVNSRGEVLEHLFGKWNESLHSGTAPRAKCIWRPGAMPQDYELYYGFSRFAIELNELSPELTKVLPPTDTRFRPDQRLLEEGNIQSAEAVKLQLEQQQRERRKSREDSGQSDYNALWFRRDMSNGEETWVYNDRYWQMRNDGFSSIEFEQLW